MIQVQVIQVQVTQVQVTQVQVTQVQVTQVQVTQVQVPKKVQLNLPKLLVAPRLMVSYLLSPLRLRAGLVLPIWILSFIHLCSRLAVR